MTNFPFRWLHLSDLHFGMKAQAPLWNNLKHHFYDDIRLLYGQTGPWDLIIFSGDIVQKGGADEYRAVTEVLVEVYGELENLGCRPIFMAVPGNHDLVRPSSDDMPSMLLRDWGRHEEVRSDFLNNPTGTYRQAVLKAFRNYGDWYAGLPAAGIPVVKTVAGLLPGDGAGRIEISGRQIGLVGLNSTWLQTTGEVKAGELHVDHRQLTSMLPDAEGWCRSNDFNLLITHQPTDWLTPGSLAVWKSEIAPPGRFDIHLFGHMHEPVASSSSIMGSSPITFFQSPSLFGLEYAADEIKRIHGYSAGELSSGVNGRRLRIWPRTYLMSKSGQGRMGPDNEFHLVDGIGTSTTLPARAASKAAGTTSTIADVNSVDIPPSQSFAATVEVESQGILERFRHHLRAPGPHIAVRRVEQDAASRALEKRALWIVADWGLSSDEFVASVLAVRSKTALIFKVDLGEIAASRTDLDQEIEAKLGLRVQQLGEELATLGEAFLLLDDVSIGDRVPGTLNRETGLEALVQTMLDYCPELTVVMRTRSIPENERFEKVQIAALDEADLKSYVLLHPEGGEDLAEPEVVGQLFSISGGVPDRIDRALKALKVVTLSELIASRDEGTNQDQDGGSESLRRVIDELDSPTYPMLHRAFRMLQALATFPHGAQFEHVKRFNGAHGFYPDNATELAQRSLIVTSTLPGLEQQSVVEKKRILTVPRTVRDVVRGRMSYEDLDHHNRRAMELYFGANWRVGSTSWPPERRYSSPKCSHHEIANASAILLRLLRSATQDGNQGEADSLLHLAAAYSDALVAGSHYYGATAFCVELLHTISQDTANVTVDRVRLNYGKSLRMVGNRDKAIEILEVLDPVSFSRSDRDSLLLNLALAYENAGDNRAVEVARRLLKATKSMSTKLQARAILLGAEPDDSGRRSKLAALEKEARNKKSFVVANNLAISLAKDSADLNVKRRYLGSVVGSGRASEDIYNEVRATIELAQSVFDEGGRLQNADHSRLIVAYQYLFIQRITTLFDRCHRLLWKSFMQRSETENLFALFRHSSFIWRIRDVAANEERYVSSLTLLATGQLANVTNSRDVQYFKARSKEISPLITDNNRSIFNK